MGETANMWYWQDYWAEGQIACCLSDDLRKGYDGALAAEWRSFFLSQCDGSRILDLCTGNGGVLLHALDIAKETGRRFQLTGVDKASIDPVRHAGAQRPDLSEVTFVGEADAKALPYQSSDFDAVTSQFGIEYAGPCAVAAEATRLLRPGGSLMFVIHAVDGTTEKAAKEELELIPKLCSPGLHDSLRQALLAVESLTRGHGTRPQADAAVDGFIRKLEGLEAHLNRHPNQPTILTLGRKLLKLFEAMERMPVAKILAYVDASERAVEAHLLRLEALSSAAFDKKMIDDLCQRLAQQGVDAQAAPVVDAEGSKLAWCICGQKTRSAQS